MREGRSWEERTWPGLHSSKNSHIRIKDKRKNRVKVEKVDVGREELGRRDLARTLLFQSEGGLIDHQLMTCQ